MDDAMALLPPPPATQVTEVQELVDGHRIRHEAFYYTDRMLQDPVVLQVRHINLLGVWSQVGPNSPPGRGYLV
jgi:hypothetical protein